MKNLMDIITGAALMPVVVIDDHTKSVELARALCAGGIPVAEITFRTDCARQAVQEIAEKVPEVTVGAGTVHTVDQARSAVDAGAKFIVTPGFVPDVVEWCLENDIPVIPGCSNATDIEAALRFGLDTVKFFPAEVSGGIKALKSFAGPYQGLRFIPTGGIDENNVEEYLSLSNVAACGGSWMVPKNLIEAGDFSRIVSLCREAVRRAFGFELLHVGVNTKDAQEAANIANDFANLLSIPVRESTGSYFAGTMFEIMKRPFLGKNGHIAIQANDMERAVHHFECMGAELDMNSAVRDEKGGLIAIYFKETIGGFAIHLRRK
ncbi:bifunctional 4-hydroxy-2-oxoglutarate aldolase/2-dehydro-3-deoxy-phosphogluconate aldolase [Caproiciproducens faecalis]|uniref:2-dehydro-3-deoxy-phosphogluconate aldolase n=1 Tax=Caproiciproducens faecalis TaxID=2820301 RepID=A0ABS7DJZ8_9FIRM|nr:bifunctional 4-hydroxy-2-oxoglutarate aldolase/2-dehydro-3-deoxy-phosphogluconate aldolase [Caproiciproducens faecalis]MBW7571431.1 bifunctional 4-hydroxy-2-oxoglutarate aldolase/2-dehydro-3-deoxy-phosphogluconate aldolase [Caproiciproducens faecalis]